MPDRKSIAMQPLNSAPEEDRIIVPLKERQKKRKARKCLCITLSGFLLLVFLGGIVILVMLILYVGDRPPKVQTTCGKVQGDFDPKSGVFIFKGIPFAEPPIAEKRWKPPERLKNTTCNKPEYQYYKAMDYPAQCAQMNPNDLVPLGSEDCLYLNIFSPDLDPVNLNPVMVYIHGGYLQWGNGSTPGYAPDEYIAKKLNMVFVSIQYRLNAFGFLVTGVINDEKGNYGLLDQIEALNWVQDNIRKFGGNPDNVHIFGQSSGGTSVFALMTSPKARGLFHSAWMLSGSPIINMSKTEAVAQNRFFIKNTNCSTEACLLNLSSADVLNALYPDWNVVRNSMDLPSKGFFEPSLLIVDGEVLPMAPFDMWLKKENGNYSDVPLIVGTTAQEVDMGPAPGDQIKKWKMEDLEKYTERRLDAFGENLTYHALELYAPDDNLEYTEDPEYIFTTMVSDLRINCGNDILAKRASEALKSPVYRYVATSFPSQPVSPLSYPFKCIYACHSWDIYAFFDAYRYILQSPSRSDMDFGDTLRKNIVSIVKNKRPFKKSHERPLWGRYPNTTALISDKLTPVEHHNHDRCEFWNSHGFFKYSWVN